MGGRRDGRRDGWMKGWVDGMGEYPHIVFVCQVLRRTISPFYDRRLDCHEAGRENQSDRQYREAREKQKELKKRDRV
jgi:hypothetical protein